MAANISHQSKGSWILMIPYSSFLSPHPDSRVTPVFSESYACLRMKVATPNHEWAEEALISTPTPRDRSLSAGLFLLSHSHPLDPSPALPVG